LYVCSRVDKVARGVLNSFFMKKIFLTIGLCGCLFVLFSQTLTVSVTATDNTDCIGRNCFYNGPTILINEVMLAPNSYDGSMVGSNYHTTGGGEWIELYNPHKCDSVDISCYFLGNNAYDNTYQSGNWGGGFALPQGTVVPPQGFCMVRGYRAAAVPSNLLVQNGGNVVEVVIDTRYCLGGGGGRLWFPNAGGWFAFYDANGVPQDAISWCSQTNSCMSCSPCTPATNDCGFNGTLASYDQIPATRKNYISSLNPQSYLGSSFRRVPDGGVWQSSPSSPTYAICNDVCVDPPEPSCNAIAVAVPNGGTPPYTYLWSDNSSQTTDTAFALCAGTYTVTVTDANLQTATAQVTVANFVPFVSHGSSVHCLNDSSAVLSGLPAGGVYTGGTFNNNTFLFNDSAAVYQLEYTIVDTNGCPATAEFSVTVNPDYTILIQDTICQREPYNEYGFNVSTAQTSTVGTLFLDSTYQTVNHCDSIVLLELVVLPSEIFTYDTAICEGEDFSAYGLQIAAADLPVGPHQYLDIFTNQYGCDSSQTVNLTVNPVYDLHETVEICQGNNYNENGFHLQTDTMELGWHEFVHQTVSSAGCDSSFTLAINVLRVDETPFYDTICQNEPYQLHHFNLTGDAVAQVGDFEFVQHLQNAFGCDSTVTLHLTITGRPEPDFVANPERVMLSENAEIQFLNLTDASHSYGSETFTWTWNFGDGNTETTVEYNTAHQYGTWGEFLVTLSVISSFGCEGSVSHYAYVDADLVFPNIMTPNGDGKNDVFAIKNLNPNLPNRLTIYDRWGKKVYEKENYQTYLKDDILYNEESGFTGENLSDGVYYYVFHYEGHVKALDYHSSLTLIR